MSQTIYISATDIFHQVKLSCQIASVIEQIAKRKIITSTATEIGLEVTPEELQEAADGIRLISKLGSADETWAWLRKNGLSIDEFEEIVYNNVVSNKLVEHLFKDKVEPWFYENKSNYAGAVIYEVTLDDEDLAMEIFFELQEGEVSFPEIAHQYIQDKELRRVGGYKGLVKRKDLKAQISAAVFAAKPPQLLKPIVTSNGIHLILVEELIQPELDDTLQYQIMSDLFEEWIKTKMEEVEVINNLESESSAKQF